MSAQQQPIDVTEITRLLAKASILLKKANGRIITQEDSRDMISARAKYTRELLFVDHLLNKARALTMDEYWVLRGRVTHLGPSPEDEDDRTATP